MRKFKNLYFYHIFVSPGDAPGAITLNVIWMEREFDAYKLPRWMCHYNRFSDRARYSSKIVIFSYPLHSTPPLRGFPSEHRHPVWYGITIMVWLPDGEKTFEDIFICFGATHERDGRTDTGWQHIPRLCIASRGKNYWTVRNSLKSILHSDRRKRLRELKSTISTGKLFHIFTTRQAKKYLMIFARLWFTYNL